LPAKIGVDAHAHVFHRGLALAPGRRYDPAADAPLSAYLAMLDRLDLAHGVLVQPSFLGTDNSFLLDCIRATGSRLRGVAVVAMDIPAAELTELGANGIAGIRLNLVGAPVPDFRSAAWRAHLGRIAEAGLHIEVQCHGPDVPRVLPPLLETLPIVVLDHFGLPPGGDPAHPVIRAILQLAAARRVYVKISAPYRFLRPSEAIGPLLTAYLNAFGADFLLWGSDWPHTQFEQQGHAGAALQELSRLLVTDHEALRSVTEQTARSLYQFKR
jgi:predicted TIM-barrel fold metal-dependent hydrolase